MLEFDGIGRVRLLELEGECLELSGSSAHGLSFKQLGQMNILVDGDFRERTLLESILQILLVDHAAKEEQRVSILFGHKPGSVLVKVPQHMFLDGFLGIFVKGKPKKEVKPELVCDKKIIAGDLGRGGTEHVSLLVKRGPEKRLHGLPILVVPSDDRTQGLFWVNNHGMEGATA